MSAYFHSKHESRASRDKARDRVESAAPVTVPFWTVPHSTSDAHRMIATESIYARSLHVEGPHHVGAGIAPLAQRTPVHTAASFLTGGGPASQASRSSRDIVRQLDFSPTEWNSFRLGPGPSLRNDLHNVGNANASRSEGVKSPALPFTSPDQAWEEFATTAFAPRARPAAVRDYSWGSGDPTRIRPPSIADHDSSIESIRAQNLEDDHDSTFVCEWTDERGMCNMDVIGDRVWMSHHLSRQHNVVGHERTQRACLWRGCTDTMNKGSLARHVVSRHLRAGASCGYCSKVYSRADVARRHTKKCKVANGTLVQQDL